MTNILNRSLLEIRRQAGALTPKAVVDAARPEDHPLHSQFEWDDAVAGEAYRISQAGELIRSVKLRYTDKDGTISTTRSWVSISRADTPSREYVPVAEAVENPILVELMLRDAEREWRQLYSRYKALEGFLERVRADVA